jgi:hypothetical protein
MSRPAPWGLWFLATQLTAVCLQAQPAGSGGVTLVEGITIDAITRQPMAGVHVMLQPLPADGLASNTYGAISGRDGHFSIAGLTPALYLLRAEHTGYLYLAPQKSAGPPDATVALKPGGQLTNLTVEMTPEAVILGHILDEFGDPVQGVQVQITPAGPGFGKQFSHPTDDRGQFRIVLPPGKFYVQTIPNNGNGQDASLAYGATFYPGAVSKERATAVELAAGQQVTGIDIHLQRSRTMTISGSVTGMPDNSKSEELRVELFSAEENPDEQPVDRVAQIGQDGSFAIAGLAAGRYRIQAGIGFPGEAGALQSPAAELQLGSADEAGVKLALVPGEAVTGTLEIVGDAAYAVPAEKPTVRLEPVPRKGSFGESRRGEVSDDGTFRVEQVFPGRLRVSVLPLPENAYIKSVSMGGVAAPDRVIDLSRGVGGAIIKVTISRNGGQVEGTVLGEDGEPLSESPAMVVLAATADDFKEGNFKPVAAGAKFRYTGLRPGKYRIIAIDVRHTVGGVGNPTALIKALFAKTPEIEIHEGDRIAKDVKVIPLEDANAKQ